MNIRNYIDNIREKNDKKLKYDFLPPLVEIVERPANRWGHVVILGIFFMIITTVVWASVGKMDVVVTGSARVVPDGGVSIVQPSGNGVVKAILVREGDTVKKGDVLVELDSEIETFDVDAIKSSLSVLQAEKEAYERLRDGKEIKIPDEEPLKTSIRYIANEQKVYELKIKQMSSVSGSSQLQADLLKSQRQSEILSGIIEKQKNIDALMLQLDKAEKAQNSQNLRAPVDGTVSAVEIKTAGRVVTSAQPVISILPADTPMTVECLIANKDIGKVVSGQNVNLKIDAFPFSKDGTIPGKVIYISPDSFQDEKLGMVYKAKVEIPDTAKTTSTGKKIRLSAGMTGTVEVTVGKRRIIDYFLEPLTSALNKSLKEQ